MCPSICFPRSRLSLRAALVLRWVCPEVRGLLWVGAMRVQGSCLSISAVVREDEGAEALHGHRHAELASESKTLLEMSILV